MAYEVIDVRSDAGDSGFLLDNGKTAILCDSGFGFSGEGIAERIEKALGGCGPDCIFLTHSHYDHALGAGNVKARWPEARIVSGERTARVLEKPSALGHMREMDRRIAQKRGLTDYDDGGVFLHADRALRHGERFDAGDLEAVYLALPGHTRCSGGLYFPRERLLFGCETLGVFGDGEEIFPACLVGYEMTLASIERIEELEIENLVVPHHGLLDRARTARYLARCRKSTEETAELICSVLRRGGSREEAAEAFIDVFYRGSVPAYYPREAMAVNTALMVKVMERELLKG